MPPDRSLPNLVDPASAEDIARAMSTWLENPDLVAAEGHRFARHWRARCDPEAIARAYLAVYRAARDG